MPTIYQVLINHEEQYALYPVGRELPGGWTPAGFSGTEDECVAHVDARWNDTRPRSVRTAATAPRSGGS
ncbi:MbtH family protein [Streptomyces sp. 15-116A]|uniref:MbtH family protein n=1 Tax=Streptomyces sp. 15-116A TaxID=2259035 RepID=UPI0021B29FC0|nr:MbtH family protein [Streptomyces sp. 15-116A]MCT7356109.1 MbtH family protein [Streptomyces sp. 15-116A]